MGFIYFQIILKIQETQEESFRMEEGGG